MPGVAAYATVGVVAALVTTLTTPIIHRISVKAGLLVDPDERNVHLEPTPSLGGVAMLCGLLAGVLTAWAIGDFSSVFAAPTEIVGLMVASIFICIVGVVDDIRPISAPAKVAGMVVAGSVLSLTGISLLVLRIPFLDLIILSPDLSALLTVVWVFLIVNAVNLIDGLDGLAAGIVGIAAMTFFLYAIRLGDSGVLFPGNPGALIAILIVAICVGFLPHNVHPARIFMGEVGRCFLAYY